MQICRECGVDMANFWAKKCEFISYASIKSFTNKYLAKNPLIKAVIKSGEDGAVSSYLPTLGKSNWAVDSINQVVEIDALSLDAMTNLSDMVDNLYDKRVCGGRK